MRRKSVKYAFAMVGATLTLAVSAVEIKKDAKTWTVSNCHYEATYSLANGGQLTHLKYGGDRRSVIGEFESSSDGQPREFDGRQHNAPQVYRQESDKDFKAEVVRETPIEIAVRFSWSRADGGSTVETLAFDDTPVVRCTVDLAWQKTPYGAALRLQTLQMKGAKSVFLPENRHFTGVYMEGQRSILPRWKYVTDGTFGFGFVAPYGEKWDHFDFQGRTPSRGWGDQCMIYLGHEAMANYAAPGKETMRVNFLFTADPKLAFGCATKELAAAPAVQLADIVPDRVFSEAGKRNGLTTTLINNAAEDRAVKVEVELSTGLDDVTKVSSEALVLKGGEMRVYHKDWAYPKGFEWGVAPRIRVLDAKTEALLDARADVVTVAERGFAAAGCAIINAKMAAQDGAEEAWADRLRRTYSGMVEYYIWSPSCWDPDRKEGQAPVADEWDPVSEHSSTRSHVTKKYLKGLIKACHERGVHVYNWITGLVNYRQAVAHPDKFQYCKNGQLQIYSGKVHGKERFAVAKLAPYTVEDSAEWGDQTADSVDMFGWDGCRWDWGFLPCAPNDPLYMSEMNLDADAFTWYDWKGRKSTDLFPDPDQTGTDCLKAWRQAVNKRHPKFVYTTNISATEDAFRKTPKYMAEAMRDGLSLLEYLIDFTRGSRTYAIWGRRLAEDNARVRANGSHSEVGHISAFLSDSVGGQLARYVCGAAGVKWWGGPMDYRYWTAKHRSLPFAMRFSEYFFGLDFRRVLAKDVPAYVKVMDGDKLYWNQFVYERTKKDVREVICHVVNVNPETDILVKQADPVPVANLKVEAMPKAGEKVIEAWGLVPGDEPKAIRLRLDGNVATLPKLEEAAVVLFRFAK